MPLPLQDASRRPEDSQIEVNIDANNIDAVTFDFYNTLVHHRRRGRDILPRSTEIPASFLFRRDRKKSASGLTPPGGRARIVGPTHSTGRPMPNACRYRSAIIYLITTLVLFAGCATSEVTPSTSYDDLVALFEEWRAFERPEFADGVPDYTAGAMAAQRGELATSADFCRIPIVAFFRVFKIEFNVPGNPARKFCRLFAHGYCLVFSLCPHYLAGVLS